MGSLQDQLLKAGLTTEHNMKVAKSEKRKQNKKKKKKGATSNPTDLQKHIDSKTTFKEFFEQANLNPNAHLIKGVICGYRIEEIDNDITRQARYLDKLIDELAKGRKMEKILRE